MSDLFEFNGAEFYWLGSTRADEYRRDRGGSRGSAPSLSACLAQSQRARIGQALYLAFN